MVLAPHVLVAMATADTLNYSLPLVIISSILVYFFIELIPHFEPWDIDKVKNAPSQKIRSLFLIEIIGSIGIIFLVVLAKLFYVSPDDNTINKYYFLLGGGISTILYFLFHHSHFMDHSAKSMQRIKKIHNKIRRTDKSIWGIAIQLAVIVVSVAFLFDAIEPIQIENIITRFIFI